MSRRLRAGIVGATGIAGQQFVVALQHHPWFAIARLAASERSAGKRFAEALRDGKTGARRWCCADEPIDDVLAIAVENGDTFDPDGLDVVFSATVADVARAQEPRFAKTTAVLSTASAFRYDPDVPLLVPNVNMDHAALIHRQRERRGWKGFVVPIPNCTVTGLVITLKPLKGQIDDLINEARKRVEQKERVLVTTLTKRTAEELTDYLRDIGISVRYLHSEIDAIERVEILRAGQTAWAPAVVGSRLALKDEIRAFGGGSATMQIPDGSTLFLAENSRLVVTELQVAQQQTRNAVFHLVVGKVRAAVAQAAITLVRTRQSNFAITTPSAVAANAASAPRAVARSSRAMKGLISCTASAAPMKREAAATATITAIGATDCDSDGHAGHRYTAPSPK